MKRAFRNWISRVSIYGVCRLDVAQMAFYAGFKAAKMEKIMTQVNDKIMYEAKRKHTLTEERCLVAHPEETQCRWCKSCVQWVRPKDFDAECPGEEPSLTW